MLDTKRTSVSKHPTTKLTFLVWSHNKNLLQILNICESVVAIFVMWPEKESDLHNIT